MLKELLSTSRKELTPFIDCFKLLDDVESGISKDIANYIVNGESSDVLLTLNTLSQDQLSDAFVWSPWHYSHNWPKKKQKALNKTAKSFKSLFQSNVFLNPDVCRRWGSIRSLCMDLNGHTPHHQKTVPDWLSAFFKDIDAIAHLDYRYDDKVPEFYRGSWLIELAEHHDLDANTWLSLLTERIECWGYLGTFLDTLIDRVDLIQLLSRDEVSKVFDKLHVSGRLSITKKLQHYESLEPILAELVSLTTDGSKQVRVQARVLVPKVDQLHFQEYIQRNYSDYPTSRRKELAQLIAVYGDENALSVLEKFAENENSKAVKESLANTIANKLAASQSTQSTIEIPAFSSLTSEVTIPTSWLESLKKQLITYTDKAKQSAEQEIQQNIDEKYKSTWRQKTYKEVAKLKENHLKAGLDCLRSGEGRLNSHVATIMNQVKLLNEPEFSLAHVIRFIKAERNHLNLGWGAFPLWLRAHAGVLTDLRQVGELLEANGLDKRAIASWILETRWDTEFSLPDIAGAELWPFFAENDEYLQETFGLKESLSNSYRGFELAHGILVVQQFPAIPEQYLQVIYQHALSPAKTYGPIARNALAEYGLVEGRVIAALASSKQDERMVAANWIADSKIEAGIPPLQKALKKEKRETAKAALLSALHHLGVDISVYLSAKALQKEAEIGLKKAPPKSLNWFPFNAVPQLKWKNGKTVHPDIITWWLVLACKLKQPEGNPLLNLYAEQLEQKSRQQLGIYILQVFTAQDTQCPTDDQAAHYAQTNQQALFDDWQRWAKSEWGQEYKNKTLADAYHLLFKATKAEYLGSAINEKGILALAGEAKGVDAVGLISRYMKDHYTRRHQIEAMLAALANNNDPIVIQLLLSIARRHRTNSVQIRAGQLVEAIASRNGWSQDELSDRTIPTAGLEPNGSQTLQLGSRKLTLKLDPQLKIVLQNEQGKLLKSLPSARQDDDPEQVKQAKKDFSSSKKELKQVIELQTSRLYEAMCIGRDWDFTEWREYLFEHPIMQHLVQKLVWKIEDQNSTYWVRPTAELDLIDLDDDDFSPTNKARITLAHISQLSDQAAQAWTKNFKEEKVAFLFSQFTMPKHRLTDAERGSTQLDYHKGWMTDAFTLRGLLTKRGYQRGEAEDGGFFTHYYKDFQALDVRVIVEFSGNCLPEENCTTALYNLAFVSCDNRGWLTDDNYKPLINIPENLINEAMLDYEAVAEKANFDKQWEKKLPW